MKRLFVFASGMVVLTFAGLSPTAAYDLAPQGTALEQSVAKKYYNWWRRMVASLGKKGLPHFKGAVHEEITHRVFGCDGDADICGDPDVGFATPYVLAGIRWNDDPPFRLEGHEGRRTSCKVTETIRFTTQPICWFELFIDAKRKAEAGAILDAKSRASLLARSHFGDLQFVHAMAAKDGEAAGLTKNRILMWAEFTWQIATGNIGIGVRLRETKIDGMVDVFGNSGWTVQDLFTLGNPALRRQIQEVALGSLLHTMQDSFADGHVDRAEPIKGTTCEGAPSQPKPGVIRQFHAYNNQESSKHAEYDSRNAFSQHWTIDKPNVIDVGQALLAYWDRTATWDQVRPYIECVFALEDGSVPASAGSGFSR